MFSPSRPHAASAYQRIHVETSMHTMDQHQLVSLLYAGLLHSVAGARAGLARGDVLAKVNGVSRALRILQEGLGTALDRADGGELAANLAALYDYCTHRLILANARNDDALLHEVMRLIEPVAQGWDAIRTVAAAGGAGAGATAASAGAPGRAPAPRAAGSAPRAGGAASASPGRPVLMEA